MKTALVLGATGGVGGAVARSLAARGWTVNAMTRQPDAAARRTPMPVGVTWLRGDSMSAADVTRAAAGAELIFHGVNPPGYRNWKGLALPMLDATIAAAKATGARIVFPGTVYNFGPDAGEIAAEDAPQNPTTRKGAIRVEMEHRLETCGAPVLIVRAGDFFGDRVGNSWLAQGLIGSGRPLCKITYPGPHGVGHAWAYMPDLAETFVQLIERSDELGRFERFHFGGHWLNPGIEMAHAIRRVIGRPDMPIGALPWWALRLVGPFKETIREMMEMRYLWQRELRLDNARLTAFLGREPHTPLDEAMAAALRGLGVLDAKPGPSATASRAVV
jgi:nucleoside-diphosphate-sugar epimerase